MAEEHQKTSHEYGVSAEGEVKDRGLFDFLGKKEGEKPAQEEVIATEFDQKVQVSEEKKEDEAEKEKKHSLIEKLHRSGSSSSSSSDEEEVEEGGEKKKKKKKGLKEKIKEKISGDKEEEKKEEEHVKTSIPIEKCDDVSSNVPEVAHPEPAEEKKGFLEKIKEKLPGGHKKTEESSSPTPAAPVVTEHHEEGKEKKGIFEKIKEKLPGYHKSEEEKKESD